MSHLWLQALRPRFGPLAAVRGWVPAFRLGLDPPVEVENGGCFKARTVSGLAVSAATKWRYPVVILISTTGQSRVRQLRRPLGVKQEAV